MARSTSIAEHYRAHRQAFELALELGCTPKEAEAELAKAEMLETRDGKGRDEVESAGRAAMG